MATPHTAGVAALYLESNPSASPGTVRSDLFNNTTKGIVTSSSTTNNHLSSRTGSRVSRWASLGAPTPLKAPP